MTLAELSLKRPVTAVMFFVSLTVVGLIWLVLHDRRWPMRQRSPRRSHQLDWPGG